MQFDDNSSHDITNFKVSLGTVGVIIVGGDTGFRNSEVGINGFEILTPVFRNDL